MDEALKVGGNPLNPKDSERTADSARTFSNLADLGCFAGRWLPGAGPQARSTGRHRPHRFEVTAPSPSSMETGRQPGQLIPQEEEVRRRRGQQL